MPSSKTLTIAALQLPTLGMNATRLEFYLKNAHERGARVMLLGEYVINHFFKELTMMPIGMVEEQSARHIELLKSFAQKYNIGFCRSGRTDQKRGVLQGHCQDHSQKHQLLHAADPSAL